MTKEDRDIIYKDACGRILYKPYAAYEFEGELIQVQITGMEVEEPTSPFYGYSFDTWGHIPHDNVKLYLRPMSSMTEEEKEEFKDTFSGFFQYFNYGIISDSRVWDKNEAVFVGELSCSRLIDWLNAHHFDYRGLIERNLAIEAPEEMYKL